MVGTCCLWVVRSCLFGLADKSTLVHQVVSAGKNKRRRRWRVCKLHLRETRERCQRGGCLWVGRLVDPLRGFMRTGGGGKKAESETWAGQWAGWSTCLKATTHFMFCHCQWAGGGYTQHGTNLLLAIRNQLLQPLLAKLKKIKLGGRSTFLDANIHFMELFCQCAMCQGH